jgi:nicotinate-nucleotide pyrophosphorylase (carboxylating)
MTPAELIAAALAEDLGPTGDITSHYFIPAGVTGRALIVAKQTGVLSGTTIARDVFQAVDPTLTVTLEREDGEMLRPGDRVMQIAGSMRALLSAERTALNFLQRLSGVATQTRHYVEAVRGTKAKVLDTRKTTPGWRALEKISVLHGGGTNHRIGLYDRVLVKDNHLAAIAGSGMPLKSIVDRIRKEQPGVLIEFEADTLEQVREFCELNVDIILFDNMSRPQMREAIAIVAGRCQTEASGGITLQNVRQIAETGVNFISIGALTHSATALDFSMEIA